MILFLGFCLDGFLGGWSGKLVSEAFGFVGEELQNL